jgi:NTP pyrophosphatase (non-canonical NTP hydrolase)
MFAKIYPVSGQEDYPATIGRFTEELGELSEALRVFPVAPGYFLSEAADVFAWLMHLQNLIHTQTRKKLGHRGPELIEVFARAYPGKCIDCDRPVCTCPPILPGTLGRIAHEIPETFASFATGGALLTQEEAQQLFDCGEQTVQVGPRELAPTVQLIRDLHSTLKGIKFFAVENYEVAKAHSGQLARAIASLEDLAAAHRVTQEGVDALATAIAELPSESRTTLMSFLSGVGSSIWATAIVDHVRTLAGIT